MWTYQTVRLLSISLIYSFPNTYLNILQDRPIKIPEKPLLLREKEGRLSLNSRFKTWPEDGVTAGDIKAFLAMIIAMGLVNQENVQDYWSTDEVLSIPFFPQLMSRDKFLNILTFFHLCDNNNYVARGHAGNNPVNKLGAVYNVVADNFSNVWTPGGEICIDEGMIPFRGKVHLKFTIQTSLTSMVSNHISCVILVVATVASLRFTQVEIMIHLVF